VGRAVGVLGGGDKHGWGCSGTEAVCMSGTLLCCSHAARRTMGRARDISKRSTAVVASPLHLTLYDRPSSTAAPCSGLTSASAHPRVTPPRHARLRTSSTSTLWLCRPAVGEMLGVAISVLLATALWFLQGQRSQIRRDGKRLP
jgi:hypothetical protein